MPGNLFGLEERQIHGLSDLEARFRLLASRGLSAPVNEDLILGLFEGDILRATGSLVGESLQGIAVDRELEGSGGAAAIVSSLIKAGMELGRKHFFLFTKPHEARIFADLGFSPVASVAPGASAARPWEGQGVALLEWGEGSVDGWVRQRATADCKAAGFARARVGGVVVNCNPFTLGHRALIEYAASQVDRLYVFVVQEDRSLFPFDVRIKLVREGTSDLANVRVMEGGPYIISQVTFPTYFLKPDKGGEVAILLHASLDLAIFRARIAPGFGIGKRFVGTEPYCATTSAYNRLMKEILTSPEGEGPALALEEIPRFEKGGAPVSASVVRALIREGSLDKVAELVPAATFDWLNSDAAASVLERIRASDSRH
ncbi:MAG: citrate (pro-3S)-lyase ligase [Spirochaetes bacterium]|nr:MAG: citrate (pro-3S)-lyase ligase [Spirochaetota bacterium]